MNQQEIAVNLTLPEQLAASIQSRNSLDVTIESIAPASAESKHKLGLATIVSAIAIVQGVEGVVKLALEIRKLLAERQQGHEETARISRPNRSTVVEITVDLSETEVEVRVIGLFKDD